MKKRSITDSYETEIKISLALLICFLLSLNFLSAYSLSKARRAQYKGFIEKLEITLENIRLDIQSNRGRLPDISYLSDIADLSGIEKIEILDSFGGQVMSVSDAKDDYFAEAAITTASIRDNNDNIAYYISVGSVNREGKNLQRLALFDTIFRLCGLVAGLVVAYLFIRTVMNPYRKIKKEAAKLDLPQINLNDADGVEYAVRTFQEVIRELKKKERILQSLYDSSEKRADSLARYNEYILGGISSGVIICNNKGVITRFNPAAEKIIGFKQKNSQDRHFKEVFGSEHHISVILSEALNNDQTYSRTEYNTTRENGETQWIGLSSSLISDNQQNKIGAAVLLTDLTRIKRLQDISDFTEKMAALGEMSAGLAHEFRNSVAAIMGFGSLIKKLIPQDNKAHSIAELIINESRATEEMLRRFLTFAKPLEVIPDNINIKQFIDDCLKAAVDFIGVGGIEVVVEDNSNNLRIPADPTLLKNAFNNLVINACQAMGQTGVLSIVINHPGEKDHIEINITDTGKGIPHDILPKIFNPFFTTKDEGTGLGLALVRKIITGHMGTIDVESGEGRGTTFIISLPTAVDLEHTTEVQKKQDSKAKTVLT
ncbi:MAG: PAS domain S-box protein [candidate division Zixibacteria bacterium]|nr:PAS domain S-box protein [candidate division Zixibacteria bacterium]